MHVNEAETSVLGFVTVSDEVDVDDGCVLAQGLQEGLFGRVDVDAADEEGYVARVLNLGRLVGVVR